MPPALADFFFIAGLEGNEPAILAGGGTSSSVRTDVSNDVPPVQETIEEESVPPTIQTDAINTSQRTSILSDNFRPISSSSTDNALIHVITPLSESSFESETSLNTFEDIMAKFTSERDEFLSTLVPPSIPVPPRSTSPFRRSILFEDEEDSVSEPHGRPRSPLRSRSSLRNKFVDLSRRASRTGTLRRGNTILSRRSSKRSSGMYNAVIPTPEPLVLPPGTHPLKRKLAPRLLGIWPTSSMTDEIRGGENAPDYLPMFAFPNDIQVRLSDERPRSTWHGFTMTKANGDRVHVCTITIWQPVPTSVAKELENQCTEWRKGNLSLEERELAESLSSRLANERALLSSLFEQLAYQMGGERDEIDEQILQCEEKIALYNELLKPIRLHAAAKVEGLTEGQGMWIPRCYGLLGREEGYQTIWREWLRAVAVPWVSGEVDIDMVNDKGLRFLPLERYIVNLCGEVPLPIQGKTQVEIAVGELRLYAAKEDVNEIPNWRDVDLYPIFRALSLKNIITLFEAAISESRIIFRSSHPAMLHSAARALVHLIWPLKFSGVFIPVLPSRLLSCLEAPVSYIIGIDRKYERLELPTDDFLLCDLDQDSIISSTTPMRLPPTIRQKLAHLLSVAARLHLNRGVPVGPPAYIQECYPKNCFIADSEAIAPKRKPPGYGKFVGLRSLSFEDGDVETPVESPIFNAFQHRMRQEEKELEQFLYGSSTIGTVKSIDSFPSFDPAKYAPINLRPSSTTLRHFSTHVRHPSNRGSGMWNNSFGRNSDRNIFPSPLPSPQSPFFPRKGFSDTSSLNGYAVSISQSSTAHSSIMNFDALALPVQTVEESEMHQWREGHSLRWTEQPESGDCDVCFENTGEGVYLCDDCRLTVHQRCLDAVTLPCLSPANFSADRIRAAFLRCFASLLYNYRKYLEPIPFGQRQSSDGQLSNFKLSAFVRSASRDAIPYMEMLAETQAFNEFIFERCLKPADDPEIALFDQIILAKRNRGRHGLFQKQLTPLLSNPPNVNLETRKSIPPNEARLPPQWQPSNAPPAKIDPFLLLPPRLAQRRSKYSRDKVFARRKPANRSDETITPTQ